MIIYEPQRINLLYLYFSRFLSSTKMTVTGTARTRCHHHHVTTTRSVRSRCHQLILSSILIYLTSLGECQNNYINSYFPLKNCLDQQLDILFIDSHGFYDAVVAPEEKMERLSDLHEVMVTVMSTFFAGGFVSNSDPRVRFSSVTLADTPIWNWHFESRRPTEELMAYKMENTLLHIEGGRSRSKYANYLNTDDIPTVIERAYTEREYFARNTTKVVIFILDSAHSVQAIQKLDTNLELFSELKIFILAFFNNDWYSYSLGNTKYIVNLFLKSENRYGLRDVENTFNLICNPCLARDSFSVQNNKGVSCFQIKPVSESSQLSGDRYVLPDVESQCENCIIPSFGTRSMMLNLEQKVFEEIHTDLLTSEIPQDMSVALNFHNELSVSHFLSSQTEFTLRRSTDTVGDNLEDFTIQPSLVWIFPALSVNQTTNSSSLATMYTMWLKETEGSLIKIERSGNISVSHCLCQLPQSRLLLRDFPSQPLDIPKASEASINKAIQRGSFFIAVSSGPEDFKLESKTNILIAQTVLDNSETTVSERGLTSHWILPEFSEFSELQMFDCEAKNRPELIPYDLVCNGIKDCENNKDENFCDSRPPEWLKTVIFQTDHASIIGRSELYNSLNECLYLKNETRVFKIDLLFNETCEEFQCPEGFVKCPQSYCIPVKYIEDGEVDCLNGEDEIVDYHHYTSLQQISVCEICSHLCLFSDIPRIRGNGFYYIDVNKVSFHEVLKSQYNILCSFSEDKMLSYRKVNFNFQCRKNNMDGHKQKGVILHPDDLCDGIADCPLADDEWDCYDACPPGLRCEGAVINVLHLDQVPAFFQIPNRAKYIDLSNVHLGGNGVTSIINNGDYVIDLRLRNCSLIDLPSRYSFGASLIYIDLSNNKIPIVTLDNVWIYLIERVNLSRNPLLTFRHGDIYNACKQAPYDNQYDCSKIYSKLKVLDLSYTSVGNTILKEIQPFRSLEEIYLRNCPIAALNLVFPVSISIVDLRGIKLPLPENHFESNLYVSELLVEHFEMCCPDVIGQKAPSVCRNTITEVISSCENLVENPKFRVIIWLMGLGAVIGNIVVIIYRIAIDKTTKIHTLKLFILNLSLADLLMGIYLLCITVAGQMFKGEFYKHNRQWREGRWCTTLGLLSILSSQVSTFFIFFVTLDRVLVIRAPFGRDKMRKTTAIGLSVGAWLVGGLIAVVPVLVPGWEVYSSSSMCVSLPLSTHEYRGKTYSVAMFLILKFVLFILIGLGQYSIMRAKASSTCGKSQTVAQQCYNSDLSIAHKLAIVVMSDFLCWFTIGVMGMMALSGKPVSQGAYALSAILIVPINSAINPLLYTVPTAKKKLVKLATAVFKSDIQTGTAVLYSRGQNLSKTQSNATVSTVSTGLNK